MGEGVKILVVDDDQQVADMLVAWLVKRGYDAHAAYGGREGLRAFKSGDHDLVITDLVMPDMDGMALLEAIKSLEPRTVVLMISGFGTVERAVTAVQKGAYDFIPKPFDFPVLKTTIDRALERHSLFKKLGLFRGLTLALIISVPLWLVLGVVLALVLK